MTILIGFETSQKFDPSFQRGFFLSQIKNYFDNKNYGIGIEQLQIGIICVEPDPILERFFKVRGPRYFKNSAIRVGVFKYDIKIEWDEYLSIPDDQFHYYLLDNIINSITVIKEKSIVNFDFSTFYNDLIEFKSYLKH